MLQPMGQSAIDIPETTMMMLHDYIPNAVLNWHTSRVTASVD